jgi:hypothetical protein
MPNRWLRASYVDSEKVNKLSAEGERMFCRLLVHVDDWGRCEADAVLLRGKLFIRQIDRVKEHQIERWIDELAENGLLFIYEDNKRKYLQMNNWEKGRAQHSKYPHPPARVNMCLRLHTRANKCPVPDPVSDTDTDTDKDPPTPTGGVVVVCEFDQFWQAYPRKIGKAAARRAWAKAKTRPALTAIIAAIEAQRASEQWRKDGGQFIPHPATWINAGRWDDEVHTPAAVTETDDDPNGDF